MGWAKETRTDIVIGIDTGVNTGVAVWDKKKKKFLEICTLEIHMAMWLVFKYHRRHNIEVRVEDARKAGFRPKNEKQVAKAMAQAQGAGSVKRDAKIWEDMLKDLGIKYMMLAPNYQLTKWTKEDFIKYTKYTGLTSNHSRDAAMRVYGL